MFYWKKQNKKIYDFSFILSHSNKGIKHSEDFEKKNKKREYLGRIIDNVSLRQIFTYITMRASYFSMRWRWGPNTIKFFL
jgi:hypothetical protein